MPRKPTELYRRGQFWLAWDRKADNSLRSPFPAIFWYDTARGRIRSTSTGTKDVEQAKLALDAHYLQHERGLTVCPTCGQTRSITTSLLVTDAVTNYQLMHGDRQSSSQAIAARLSHIVAYLAQLPDSGVTCDQVDEGWITGFRAWSVKQPIVSPSGKLRVRTTSTVENSVLQLAAAINHAHRRGDTMKPAQFKPIAMKELNRTPRHRSSVAELAKMLAYAIQPSRKKRREPLRRFLIISIATLARPDAALDVSTAPERGQWDKTHGILDLNPRGRRQTKKYRAVVPVAHQVMPWLNACGGKFVGAASVQSGWRAMAGCIGLPSEGEGGTKLIRRSMAKLLRDRLPPAEWSEVEMFLGHRKFDSTSDIYAPFDPSYCAHAKRAIETLIDEIEALTPGAFSLD
jgi:integrase